MNVDLGPPVHQSVGLIRIGDVEMMPSLPLTSGSGLVWRRGFAIDE
jgi:hypothetical protein